MECWLNADDKHAAQQSTVTQSNIHINSIAQQGINQIPGYIKRLYWLTCNKNQPGCGEVVVSALNQCTFLRTINLTGLTACRLQNVISTVVKEHETSSSRHK